MRPSAQRYRFCELVLDVYDVCFHAAFGIPLTLELLGAICGTDPKSTPKRFRRMRDQLGRHGIELRLIRVDGLPKTIGFDRAKLLAFVRREIDAAEEVLAPYKRAHGRARFVGNKHQKGSRAHVPPRSR